MSLRAGVCPVNPETAYGNDRAIPFDLSVDPFGLTHHNRSAARACESVPRGTSERMPTFFRRRYLRDRVPRLEIVIGIGILLMTAGIVVALVRSIRPASRKLFEPDPRHLQAVAEPADLRVASQMMPVLPPDWGAAGAVEVRRGDAVADWCGGAADAFRSNGVVCAYRGQFAGPGGATAAVTVFDVGTPEHAEAIQKARRPATGAAATVGRGGFANGPRVGFWNGRYYTEVESGGPDGTRVALEVARAAAGVQLSYGPASETPAEHAATSPNRAAAAGRPAQFPELGGSWHSPPAAKRFDKDTLYEKIDGKAGMFLSYLFVELQFATYQRADKGWTFDVYVYDMGEPVNAFGIYRLERSPEAMVQPLGREGYTSGASVFFWKGRYYVNVLGPPDDATAAKPAEELAAAIAATIADDGKGFWAESVFPAAGRKPGSLSYKASDGLGYGFLRQVFVCDYTADGKAYQLFVHRAVDGKALFEQYVEAVTKYNKVLVRKPVNGGELLVSESLGVFEAAFYKGVVFGGVTECDDAAVAEKQAAAFCESIDPAAVASAVPAPAPPPAAEESKAASETKANGGDGGEGVPEGY